MSRFARLCVSVISCLAAGLVGSFFVDSSTASWYDALHKPAITPPHWLFPFIWLLLYVCMGLALWLVWEKDELATEVRGWVPLFYAHLLVNVAWTIFFFGFHAIGLAFVDMLVLIACVIILMCGAWDIDRRATYLLSLYLAWVLFASVLNIWLWFLN